MLFFPYSLILLLKLRFIFCSFRMYMYDYLKKRGLSYTAEIFRKEGHVTTQPPFGIYTPFLFIRFIQKYIITYEARTLLGLDVSRVSVRHRHI